MVVGLVQEVIGARAFTPHSLAAWVPWVCGLAAVVWVASFVFERWRGRPAQVGTALLAGLALAAVLLHAAPPLKAAATGDAVRAWNVFHYYVGSKYFAELGYTDLYLATLEADARHRALQPPPSKGQKQKHARDFGFVQRARNQVTGELLPLPKLMKSFDPSVISEERLEELGADTRFLRPHLNAWGWKQVLQDLGYNPAPPWTIVGTTLSNVVPARWPWFGIITNGDLLLFFAMALVLWWAAGVRVAAVCVLWVCAFEVNTDRLSGGFLQYDWLASTVIAGALLLRGRHGGAGVALSWGAMTRVFPGFLVLPFVIQAARSLTRRQEVAPRHRRFLVAFAVSCSLLFVGSHLTGRGLSTWPEWVAKISRHSEEHAITSNRRVGVGRLAQHEPRAGAPWRERQGTGPQRLAAAQPMKRALQLLGLLLLLPALWHRDDRDGFALAGFAGVLLVVLSRYYASTWVVLFLLAAPLRGPPGEGGDAGATPWAGVFAGAGLLALAACVRAPGDHTGNYFLLNWWIYLLFAGLCVGWLVADLRAGRFRRQGVTPLTAPSR